MDRLGDDPADAPHCDLCDAPAVVFTAEIDHGRSPGNLSSALRLFVLDELRKRTISRV